MKIWDAILEIKNLASTIKEGAGYMAVRLHPEIKIMFDEGLSEADFTVGFRSAKINGFQTSFSSSVLDLSENGAHKLSEAEVLLLQLYLPYALLPYYAKIEQKCFAISHFAQTLDGRIASFSGDSKWIGNEENLVHAHRMRALCDAILIGANTLAIDNPRLNVRLVKGADPQKVIVGGDRLSVDQFNAVDATTLMFCHDQIEVFEEVEKIILEKRPVYNTTKITEILFEKGIKSVYVEGGSFTTSNFLHQGSLDQVQVHISPLILGSGKCSFAFDGINYMDEAIRFANCRFIPVGKDIMFVGNPA